MMGEPLSAEFVSMSLDGTHAGVWNTAANGSGPQSAATAVDFGLGNGGSSLLGNGSSCLTMADSGLVPSAEATQSYGGGSFSGNGMPCGSSGQPGGAYLSSDGQWMSLMSKQSFVESPDGLALQSQMMNRGDCGGGEWMSMMNPPPSGPQGLCTFHLAPPNHSPQQTQHGHSASMFVGGGGSLLSGGEAFSVAMSAQTATPWGGHSSYVSSLPELGDPSDSAEAAFLSNQRHQEGESRPTSHASCAARPVASPTASGAGSLDPRSSTETLVARGDTSAISGCSTRLKRKPRPSASLAYGGDVAKAVAAAADKGLSPGGTRPAKYFKQRASSKAPLKASRALKPSSVQSDGVLGVGSHMDSRNAGGGIFGEGVKREVASGCAGASSGGPGASEGVHNSTEIVRPPPHKPGCRVRGPGSSEVMAKMYFHRKKEAWRAELLIQGTKKQKSFSCRLYGYDRARMMCEWARKFVLYTSRLPTDEETCSSLAALMCEPLPQELPPPFPEGSLVDSQTQQPTAAASSMHAPFGERSGEGSSASSSSQQRAGGVLSTSQGGTSEGSSGKASFSGGAGKASIWKTRASTGNACRQKRRELLKMVTSTSGEKLSTMSIITHPQNAEEARRAAAVMNSASLSNIPSHSSLTGSAPGSYGGGKTKVQSLPLGSRQSGISTGGRQASGSVHTAESSEGAFGYGCEVNVSEEARAVGEEGSCAGGGASLNEASSNGSDSYNKAEYATSVPGPDEPLFEELLPLKKLTRPKGGRAKRFNVGKKPFSGVRGIYFQQGLWKVKYKGDQDEAMKLFPYVSGDERDMLVQFEQARAFLRQVIDKGRHLHDSDGEGLSEDEPAWLGRGLSNRSLSKRDAQALNKASAEEGGYGGGGQAKHPFVQSGSSRRRLAVPSSSSSHHSSSAPSNSASGAAVSGREKPQVPATGSASADEEASISGYGETSAQQTSAVPLPGSSQSSHPSSSSGNALCRIMGALPQHVRDAADGFQASSGLNFFQPVYRQPTEGPQASLWGPRTDSVCANVYRQQSRIAGDKRKQHKAAGRLSMEKATASSTSLSKSLQELTTDDSLGSTCAGGVEGIFLEYGSGNSKGRSLLSAETADGSAGSASAWLAGDTRGEGLGGANLLSGETRLCNFRARAFDECTDSSPTGRPSTYKNSSLFEALPFEVPEDVAPCSSTRDSRMSSSAAFTADLPEEADEASEGGAAGAGGLMLAVSAAPRSGEASTFENQSGYVGHHGQELSLAPHAEEEGGSRLSKGVDAINLSSSKKASRRGRSGGSGKGSVLGSSEELSEDFQCMASYPWDSSNDFFSAASSPQRLRTAASAVALLYRPSTNCLLPGKESPTAAQGNSSACSGDEALELLGLDALNLRGDHCTDDMARSQSVEGGLHALKLRMTVCRSSGVADNAAFASSPTPKGEWSMQGCEATPSLASDEFVRQDREGSLCGDAGIRFLQLNASAPHVSSIAESGLMLNREAENASGEGLRAARPQSRGCGGLVSPNSFSLSGESDLLPPWAVVTPPQDAVGFVFAFPNVRESAF